MWDNRTYVYSLLQWQDLRRPRNELRERRGGQQLRVRRVLTVEDGLENPLTGVAIYLLRTSTKRTLGEETFQREIMCGMLNAQVKTFSPNPRTFIRDCLATNGRVRLIIIFLRFFPTTSCHSVIRTHVSRAAPDWDAPPTELQRRGRSRLLPTFPIPVLRVVSWHSLFVKIAQAVGETGIFYFYFIFYFSSSTLDH